MCDLFKYNLYELGKHEVKYKEIWKNGKYARNWIKTEMLEIHSKKSV